MRPERLAAVAAALLLALCGATPARADHRAGSTPANVGKAGGAPGVGLRTPAGAGRSTVAAPPGAAGSVGAPGRNTFFQTPGAPGAGSAAQPILGGVPLGPDPSAQDGSLSGPGPLVANGLGSPSCRDPLLRTQLSAEARANCTTSGVTVAPAPLEHYQFDVHIDTGLLGQSSDTLIQNVLLKPVWMGLVWLSHVAVVALEWCFSLDLLGSGTLAAVADGLQRMRDALTTPWLGPVLALAAIAFLYNGVVRRRVVDTLGQFALLLAMMIGGLWVIADPGATVGAASRLVNETSLGALGAAATGDADHPLRSLDDALRPLFGASVTGPWCYLEFGDVGWCREPSLLDPGLLAAAREIVARDRTNAASPAERRQVQVEAVQIGRARTNGELFLALPSNGPRRNSINADSANPSLLRVLCGGDTATSCPADTNHQAEFRTQKGTGPRIGGLLLIVIGAAGMFALVGFLCLRLLGAALLVLLYLLLAPIAVLAPALGDGGRAAFRHWSVRLLGAVLSKLVYSVFLGVTLLMVRVLADLGGLGWWTQWLLIAAFFWLVFNHRHRLLEHVVHERGEPTRRSTLANRMLATRQAVKLASPPARALGGLARGGFEQIRHLPQRGPERRRRRSPPDHGAELAEQVSRPLERDHAAAVATVARGPALELDLGELRTRRDRLRGAHRVAAAAGDRRRSVSLARREHAVDAQIEARERELAAARAAVPAGEERRRRTGLVHDEVQRAERAELFDREADLRPRVASASDPRAGRRDYAKLAGLADITRRDLERLPDTDRRRAALEIDRALERRREWSQPPERSTPRELVGRLRRPSLPPDPPYPRPPDRAQSRRERQFKRHAGGPDSRPRRERPNSGAEHRSRQFDRPDR